MLVIIRTLSQYMYTYTRKIVTNIYKYIYIFIHIHIPALEDEPTHIIKCIHNRIHAYTKAYAPTRIMGK